MSLDVLSGKKCHKAFGCLGSDPSFQTGSENIGQQDPQHWRKGQKKEQNFRFQFNLLLDWVQGIQQYIVSKIY